MQYFETHFYICEINAKAIQSKKLFITHPHESKVRLIAYVCLCLSVSQICPEPLHGC